MQNTQCETSILILNWNNYKLTLDCLESLLILNSKSYKVVVCDNKSSDGSFQEFIKWALRKQINIPNFFQMITADNIFSNEFDDQGSLITFIQNGSNGGYAAGNNIGIQYILKNTKSLYIWLLNNDTVVHPDALKFLVECAGKDRTIGICGSTILNLDSTDRIQVLGGGKYNKLLGTTKNIGQDTVYRKGHIDTSEILAEIDYIYGASMLVSREFIEEIGLLCEDYFLYYEELDWAYRAKNKFKLDYAPESIVYHREGSSIGSSYNFKNRSSTSEFYSLRNRIIFTSKYNPIFLITVYISLLAIIFVKLFRGNYKSCKYIIMLLFNPTLRIVP